MTSVMTAQPDVMRGLVRLAAVGVPSGNVIVTRQAGRGAPDTIRGGTFSVTNGGFIATDSEPLFGTSLTYRVVDTPTTRAIQTNRVLNPKAAVDLTNWTFPAARTAARETSVALKPPRDATTSIRIGPRAGGVGAGSLAERKLAQISPSGLAGGRWYLSGQLMYDSPDIWLWDDVKSAGTWQTIKNRGTWQDVKAANSPLAGQPFASLFTAVLDPSSTTTTRTQLARNPRVAQTPIGEWATTNGGSGVVNGSVVASGGPSAAIPGFYRGTWTTASATPVGGIVYGNPAGANTSEVTAVTPGQPLTASAYVRSSKAQRLYVSLTYFNASGTVVGSVVNGVASVVTAGAWTRLSVADPAVPTGAAIVFVYVTAQTGTGGVAWAVADTLDVTGILAEHTSVTVPGGYFDGATAVSTTAGTSGSTVASYAWNGTAWASSSVETTMTGLWVTPFQILGVQTGDNGGWATFQGILDIPVGAPANCQVAFFQGTVTREYTVTWWLSTLMVCPEAESLKAGAVLPYFDGDTTLASIGDPGDRLAPGYDWKALSGDASITWQGTPNASWSQFTGPSQIFSDVSTAIGKPSATQLPRVNQPIFLSDPVVPQLSQWFELVEIGDLTFSARQQLFDVLGREAQIAVSQVRSWASGEMRLMTYTPEQQAVAERLFGVGRILYWRNPDPRYPENGWYVAIGDVVAGRPGATVGWAPERIWRIPFVKVERPEGLIAASSSVTWSTVKASYTWQQLRDQRKDWLDAAITAPGA
jgi:hypothetical protein